LKKEIYQLTYELEEKYWWYVARRKIILDQLQSLLNNIKGRTPSLLDIGCGTGKNLTAFLKFSEAYGIDSSMEAIQFCLKRGLTNIALQDLSKDHLRENPFGKKFDFITMLDVVEHIDDDVQCLSTISKWLTEEGLLFLTVPAYQWLWSGEDYISYHVRRYSRKHLAEIVRKAGFVIEKISYFNTFLFPAQALVILFNRVFSAKSKTQSNLQEMPEFINSILQKIMSAESPLLKQMDFPLGGSILCICRKIEEKTMIEKELTRE
jgi:2-polyprenyl-3-methyl-5-hydroxy-6-metoxy-1,4-benzoquinol methylase